MRHTLLLVVMLASHALHAEPIAASTGVPAPLAPWVPWVLHGHEEELRCPLQSGAHVCAWPASLSLELTSTKGTFKQEWRAFTEGILPLPGDAKHWPLDVKVDGKPATVIDHAGTPQLPVSAGVHVVTGVFAWDKPPDALGVPPDTGVLTLSVNGKSVAAPDRDDATGAVFLKRDADAASAEEDRLDVHTFRKVHDGVPLLVETRVLLEVSGKSREVVLPGVVLDGTTAMSLSSPLPARVEDHALRVQVRPGTHTLTVEARRVQAESALVAPKPDDKGTKTDAGDDVSEGEVWVFEADHAVRVAHVEGVPAIAAEQTRLPDEWRKLPAYRVLPGESFTLVQERRGDESPAPDQLTLSRTLWLDFEGKGFMVRDVVDGHFTHDRLEMAAGTTLGRVSSSDGGDQFITRLDDSGVVGVEVRAQNIHMIADSRIEGGTHDIPAVGFRHDFQQVRATLHLPPGWSLLSASGVDSVHTTWIKSWSLFELFLLLVLTASMGRLWGRALGAVALVTFTLTFQESDAPRLVWIAIVVGAALGRVLPEALHAHTAGRLLWVARLVASLVLLGVVVPFAVHQVRVGLHPVLEQPDRALGDGNSNGYAAPSDDDGIADARAVNTKAAEPMAAGAAAPMQAKEGESDLEQQENSRGGKGYGSLSKGMSRRKNSAAYQQLTAIDPSAIVQTGPGVPQWGFSTVQLGWNGPVQQDQRIELTLLSPPINRALAFLRVLLVTVLVLAAFGFPGGMWPAWILKHFRGRGALFGGALVLMVALTSSPARADDEPQQKDAQANEQGANALAKLAGALGDTPDAPILDELRARLLEPPKCAPDCASMSRVAVSATASTLTLRFEVLASERTAVALPGADKQWVATSLLVDGKPASAVRRGEGKLWLVVEPGRHDVVEAGPLARRDTVSLALPQTPHHATFTSSDWTLAGLHEDGLVDANLELTRVQREEKAAGNLAPGVLPPFVVVTRAVRLGLSFEVETHVTRASPPGTPVVLEVPLLAGESVTTENVRVKDGRVQLNLGPSDVDVQWRSVLATTDKLELVAPADAKSSESMSEQWELEASPVWHVTTTGIPPIHDDDARGGARAWRPWPGEKLTLAITRPLGVPGQTLTIEHSVQTVHPGLRSTDVTLTLDVRSSRGGQHTLHIPAGAEVLSVSIGGQSQPLRPDGDKLVVPVVPGAQHLEINVRVPRGITTSFVTPEFALGAASVNAEVVLELPTDRWLLWVAGPHAGPAVLFWSTFLVVMLTSVALSRVKGAPLSLVSWVLLGLGLTQVPIAVAGLVEGWLLVLVWRKNARMITPGWFNLRQVFVVVWTVAALVGLVAAIHEGLLGQPDMMIEGNGSSGWHLRWFADRVVDTAPQGHVWSVPMTVYRFAMLAWALWLAVALLRWLRFGWEALSSGRLWFPPPPRTTHTAAPHTTMTSTSTSTTGPGLASTVPVAHPPVTTTTDTTNTPDAPTEPTPKTPDTP